MMKKIFIILLLVTSLFSKTLDTYTVDLEQIDTIRSLDNERIVVVLKDKYWENFFEFTRENISKKVIIKIDTIDISPTIFSSMYYTFELSSVRPEDFSKNLKLLLSKKTMGDKTILLKKRNIFLNKMLKKHLNDSFITAELIALYHKEESLNASKQCIELYESAEEKTKIKLIVDRYNDILDCYLDLNNTKKALDFLSLVEQKIYQNDLYLVLEKEAYIHTLTHQPKKAKKAYIEALKILKKTNWLKEVSNPDKMLIKEIEMMRESEIKRLEAIISDYDIH